MKKFTLIVSWPGIAVREIQTDDFRVNVDSDGKRIWVDIKDQGYNLGCRGIEITTNY